MWQPNLLKSREKVQNMDKGVMDDLIAKIWKPEREGQNKECASRRPGTILGRFFIQSASKANKPQSHLMRGTDVARWTRKRCGIILVGERARQVSRILRANGLCVP
jgi:hypothetical protein